MLIDQGPISDATIACLHPKTNKHAVAGPLSDGGLHTLLQLFASVLSAGQRHKPESA